VSGINPSFHRTEIAASRLQSLAFDSDGLVDWVAGRRYRLDGKTEILNTGNSDSSRFDAAVGLGSYGVVFEAHGTKGLLLRENGKRPSDKRTPLTVDVIREIDRSDYRADNYWYPVALFDLYDGRRILAHCPRGYNVIDLEELDGKCLTPRSATEAEDVFHSRLEASVDGRWLLSNGWIWQPCNVVCVYDLARAIAEPAYLSTRGEPLYFGADWDYEIWGATFIGHRVICSGGEESRYALGIYDLRARCHEGTIKLSEPAGTRLMLLDHDHVVLFDGQPRVLQLSTGRIIKRFEDLDGGAGVHQPGVRMAAPAPPWLAVDAKTGRFALGEADRIVVISAVP
jgi:hypothetical protein